MRILIACFILLFEITFCSLALAQMTCVDIRGLPVASIPDNTLKDIASARLAPNGTPVIYYNPEVVFSSSPQTQLFFYAHECGHHALGHTIGMAFPLTMEQDADCYAIKALVDKNMVSDNDIIVIQNDIFRAGKADWTHLPGPQRAINLRECLKGTQVPMHNQIVPDDYDSETRDPPPDSKHDDSCQEEYETCKFGVRTEDQCIQEEYPQRCINSCTGQFGFSQARCENELCQPTSRNMSGWIKSCQKIILKEHRECSDQKRRCEGNE